MGRVGERRRSDPRRRLTVAQAADQLGISIDAMRARVKRGTVATEREGGRVYVLLDTDQDADQDEARAGESSPLISQLREEVSYLREENRRKDHIIAGLVERIPPALEAPASEAPDERGSPETGSGGVQRGSTPQEERPWWRRVFGR